MTKSVRVDMAGVARRKRRKVDELVELHLANFKASGAELVMGEARFTEPKTVRVAVFLLFGYQKWFEYEAQTLISFISNGPLTAWM